MGGPLRYLTKPRFVKAMEFKDGQHDEIIKWVGAERGSWAKSMAGPMRLFIEEEDGHGAAKPGDYIVQHDDETFEVFPRELFEEMYMRDDHYLKGDAW